MHSGNRGAVRCIPRDGWILILASVSVGMGHFGFHAVARAMTLPLFCGRNEAEFEQRASWLRTVNPMWADLPIMDIFDALRPMFGSLTVGTPTEVAERLRAYAAAGVSEVMLQWGGFDDIEGLHLIAEEVIPLLAD